MMGLDFFECFGSAAVVGGGFWVDEETADFGGI